MDKNIFVGGAHRFESEIMLGDRLYQVKNGYTNIIFIGDNAYVTEYDMKNNMVRYRSFGNEKRFNSCVGIVQITRDDFNKVAKPFQNNYYLAKNSDALFYCKNDIVILCCPNIGDSAEKAMQTFIDRTGMSDVWSYMDEPVPMIEKSCIQSNGDYPFYKQLYKIRIRTSHCEWHDYILEREGDILVPLCSESIRLDDNGTFMYYGKRIMFLNEDVAIAIIDVYWKKCIFFYNSKRACEELISLNILFNFSISSLNFIILE